MQSRDGPGRITPDKNPVGINPKRVKPALTRNAFDHATSQKAYGGFGVLGCANSGFGKFGVQWVGYTDTNPKAIGCGCRNITSASKFLTQTGHHRIVACSTHKGPPMKKHHHRPRRCIGFHGYIEVHGQGLAGSCIRGGLTVNDPVDGLDLGDNRLQVPLSP